MKTGEDFRRQSIRNGIIEWAIGACSMCDYPLKYIFSLDKEQVSFDAGCDCVTYSNIQPRSWGDLAEHYNMQTSEEYIAEMDEFWGFQELEAA